MAYSNDKKQIAKLEYAFDKRLHIASDFDLIIRLSRFCYFDYVPEVLCNYRIHQSNTSSNKKKELSELSYILHKYNNDQKIKKFLEEIFSLQRLKSKIFIKIY